MGSPCSRSLPNCSWSILLISPCRALLNICLLPLSSFSLLIFHHCHHFPAFLSTERVSSRIYCRNRPQLLLQKIHPYAPAAAIPALPLTLPASLCWHCPCSDWLLMFCSCHRGAGPVDIVVSPPVPTSLGPVGYTAYINPFLY